MLHKHAVALGQCPKSPSNLNLKHIYCLFLSFAFFCKYLLLFFSSVASTQSNLIVYAQEGSKIHFHLQNIRK